MQTEMPAIGQNQESLLGEVGIKLTIKQLLE